MITGRTSISGLATILSAAALAALALSGCQSQAVKSEPASSTSTQSSPATTTMTTASATSPSSATTTASAAAPAGDKVGAADLPAIVSDRTFRGADEGETYTEYYAPDGSLRGKSASQNYTGSWKVVGEQLCFTYTYPDKTDTETDCYAVFKNGDVVTWVDEDGQLVEGDIIEGNADGL